MDKRFLLPGIMLCLVLVSVMAIPAREKDRQKMPKEASERITLPEPKYVGVMTVEEALKKRSSVRVLKMPL